MSYIVFDLEFNQGLSKSPFEIIQVGAIKLDDTLNTIDTFNRFVRPTRYTMINPFITELTGITMNDVQDEAFFPTVYEAFIEFIGKEQSIFCIWGSSDLKELIKNAQYHTLDTEILPKAFVNIQPYISKHLHLSTKKLLSLKDAVLALSIPQAKDFHNAFHDAYYTAELLKKLDLKTLQIQQYNKHSRPIRQVQSKKQIDTQGLLKQFEKMYNRPLSEDEKAIVLLAYKMGKTNQFLK